MNKTLYTIVFILGIVSLWQTASGQEKKVAPTSEILLLEIATQDSLLFAAFNRQDMEAFKAFFAKDLEWYQDNGGLIHYDTVFMNFRNNFRKVDKLTRSLIKNTFEVHPIKDYGAIETGTHQFRHMENGKMEIGTFKFLMIWKKGNDSKWRITRVVSYDH